MRQLPPQFIPPLCHLLSAQGKAHTSCLVHAHRDPFTRARCLHFLLLFMSSLHSTLLCKGATRTRTSACCTLLCPPTSDPHLFSLGLHVSTHIAGSNTRLFKCYFFLLLWNSIRYSFGPFNLSVISCLHLPDAFQAVF